MMQLLMSDGKNIPCSDVFLQFHVCSHMHTVDGMRFAFDPSKPAGSRVVSGSVFMRDRPLVRKRHTILRGQKVDTAKNCIEKMSIKDKVDNINENRVPEGYSPLDPSKTYSLVSKAYLISGKVSK